MRARVHFKTPESSGSFETEILDISYKEWVLEVGTAAAKSGGWGFFAGSEFSFPLRYITEIRKVED